ncbi:hypothetical protein CCR75_000871 [Bremia lactucae]|uniref:Uncharacterized protein n=1 Tax=Bremia lactucae TaxID=4779 RepID=A0A976FNR7_BRELC|nr:hypothetical protein CCR75_000871 [Bremia lactucae]
MLRLFGFTIEIWFIGILPLPNSKLIKVTVTRRMEFLIGYRYDVVGCHTYFPKKHITGFLFDVKMNETIKLVAMTAGISER